MTTDADPPPPVAPRSPKRMQDDLDELIESASKRSRTASPGETHQQMQRQEEGNGVVKDDDDDAPTTTSNTEITGSSAEGASETQDESKTQNPPPPPLPVTAEPPAAPATSQADDNDTAETETKAAPKSKMCGVCHEKEGKYKCARCALPFCSVPCNKIHRENHPPDPEPAAKPPPPPDVAAGPPPATKKARDPSNPFSVLDDSDQLRYLFKRYPSLRSRLLGILAATEPPPEMRGASGTSLNDIMKAKAMAAANPKKEQWTHDIGIRNGKEALRKAKNAAGEDGEGVREYIELINHLVSKGDGGNDADADEAIRRRAAQQDTELIRRLMADDRG
ncbi:hit finger domain protein [Colletotrichum truncatum]|uniref:Hit finger domain protein n=1 Tax=Colletotrichum truncatum TaxID=5467 RepID=A0ACC3Z9J3_COLTU|nr:hit finger domain protein [Colletotrichum truncatum]KAF6793627.1 hit finger domain protein [Colletotrichum truncatum]